MFRNHKTLSRVLGLVLALALLAACGSPATPAPAPAAPAADGNAPAGDAGDVAPIGEEIVIGLLAPLTGGVAQFGIAVQQGAMLYIDRFNAQGGTQIRVIAYDEEGDPANAIVGYNHLHDQGVTAILGSVTSGPTIAVVPLAYEDGMPMITATATQAGVTFDAANNRVWTNMFRSCFIDPFQGTKMAEFAVGELGAQTAAILMNNDIDYSIGLTDAFVAKAAEIGLEIVATEIFGNDTVDFLGQLTNIAAHNPDVLFIPAYYEDIALIGPQSVAAGLDTVMLGADGWAGTTDLMDDASSIEGSFYLTGFTVESTDAHVQEFIAAFEAAYGVAPNMFAAQAYDAAAILIAALEAALAEGLTPATDEFKASVIGHMAATNITGVTGYIYFDEFNNPQKTAFIIEIRDGASRFWGTF
ncbi:MAG: ABC transporter substrate-binding protein [Oscillospiraceae bacterium]|nr:ABC transporter substrate-binding protein [Oscillospiraceae bacterium]